MTDTTALHAYATRRDAEAFAHLVKTYERFVLAACRRKLRDPADLDDAVQETFLRLARHADEPRGNVGGWLHRCAVNVAIDINRRHDRREKHETDAARQAKEAANPTQSLAELREHLDSALEKLDAEQRELIIQRYFVGRAQVDLASEAGVAPSTITHRLERAIAALREHLTAGGFAPAVAGGAALVEELLQTEAATAVVSQMLTANLMKIGLSGAGASAGAVGTGAGAGILIAKAAAVILALGALGAVVWKLIDKPTAAPVPVAVQAPQVQAQSAPAVPQTTIRTAAGGITPEAPNWRGAATAPGNAVLAGQVVDESGRPVANAQLTLHGTGARAAAPTARTDAEGNYTFAGVPADGEYRIGVRAEGFITVEPYISNMPAVQITAGASARRDIVMQRGVPVVISVTDGVGQPLPRARVAGDQPDSRRVSIETHSDDLGQATLLLVPSPVSYVVFAQAEGFAPSHVKVEAKSPDEPVDANLVLTKGLMVEGVAMCSDGKPATGWEIIAYPDWWVANTIPRGVPIDGEGRFKLSDIAPGRYRIMISIRSGDYGMLHQIASTELPPKDGILRLDLPMVSPASRARLVGRVRFNGPQPDYVEVVARGTSPDGQYLHSRVGSGRRTRGAAPDPNEFVFENIPKGVYRIEFQSPMIESKVIERVEVPGELPEIELNVIGKTRLAGTVVDVETGEPLNHFAVRVRKIRTLGEGPNYVQDARWTQVSNPQGRFDIELVGPGVYRAQASRDGYAWAWSPEVSIERGSGEVQIRLSRGGTLTGTVLDPAGNPVADALVIPFSKAQTVTGRISERRFGGDAGAVRTDAQGRFSLENLPAGREMIKLVHPDYAPAVVQGLEVVEGKVLSVGELRMQVGGTVEGIVYDPSGNPQAGVVVQFQDASGYSGDGDEEAGRLAAVMTDENGFYRAEHLPAQILWVNLADRWERGGIVRRIIRPVDGKTARIDFGGTIPIAGRLVKDGKPMGLQRVRLTSGSEHFGNILATSTTDSDGRFTFMGPPPGTYKLFVAADTSRGDWIAVRDATFTGDPIDLGEILVDVGTVTLMLTADDPEELNRIAHVSIATHRPGQGWDRHVAVASAVPDRSGVYRADAVPLGDNLRATVTLSTKPSRSLIVPFQRKPGAAEMTVKAHLPRSTATLRIGWTAGYEPAKPTQGIYSGIILRGDDPMYFVAVAPEKNSSVAVELPPGTYRVMDPLRSVPSGDYEPIVLKAGETSQLLVKPINHHRTVAQVWLRVWDSAGAPLLHLKPALFDADGNTIQPHDDTEGTTAILPAGKYRATLTPPGRDSIVREFEVPAALDETDTRQTHIDIIVD